MARWILATPRGGSSLISKDKSSLRRILVCYACRMKYCPHCAGPVEMRVPEGDHLPRHVCSDCGTVHYRNPKVVVGCIPEWEGRILLCRRAIEPRLGLWTFPAGFLEIGETTAEGARRETAEEAGATVEIEDLLSIINVPYVGQVYVIYRARMTAAHHHPTPESSETCLVDESRIPWDDIAFPTIWHSLRFWCADRAAGRREFHALDLTRKPERGRPEAATGVV
jgi:ADP-ribose pyrophosphatase YjhB (NUDIX family)